MRRRITALVGTFAVVASSFALFAGAASASTEPITGGNTCSWGFEGNVWMIGCWTDKSKP